MSITRICQVCGNKLPYQNRKYCSQKCYGETLKGQIPHNKKFNQCTCGFCGKSFHIKPSRKRLYCSRRCYSDAHKHSIICEYCGKSFNIYLNQYKKRNIRFCSNECRAQSNKVKFLCETCGKIITAYKSRKRKYCSRECFWTSNQKFPSSLEKILQCVFPDNIRYTGNGVFWVVFKNKQRKCPDFVVNDKKGKYTNHVIEAHGNYWHSGEDAQKLIDLYAEVGYKCLVLWESEVKENLPNVLSKVAEFISLPTWQLKLF